VTMYISHVSSTDGFIEIIHSHNKVTIFGQPHIMPISLSCWLRQLLIVCQTPSLLAMSRVAVVKLMRKGHQLELHDLPMSLWRLVTMVTLV